MIHNFAKYGDTIPNNVSGNAKSIRHDATDAICIAFPTGNKPPIIKLPQITIFEQKGIITIHIAEIIIIVYNLSALFSLSDNFPPK